MNLTTLWSVLTLGLAVMFGIMGKPAEMGIIVVAGAITVAFQNIDKIQKFKGAGFEAEMKRAVAEANATIKQLREVASTSSEVILTDLMSGSFFDGITLETRLNLHDKVIQNLKEIGASKKQIDKADDMWRRGIGIIFHRGIRCALEGRKTPHQTNMDAEKHIQDASREFNKLLKFEEWKAATPNEMRKFIEEKNAMNSDVDELLKDYSEFLKSGELRRRDVFVKL